MKTTLSCLAASALSLLQMTTAQAATVTGQVNASLILISSCQVNGAVGSTGVDFGTLSFGTSPALFTTATGQVLNTTSGSALSILCSNGTTPSVTVNAGAHDGLGTGGTRALADGTGHFVGYDLFTNAGFSQLLAIGGVINLAASTGVAQTVNIYGRAIGAAGLPAGTYTDTVAVQLSF